MPTYAWGDEFTPGGRWMANTWQGEFPIENTASRRLRGHGAGRPFPPNGYGLFDMTGNVWEWTSDWYTAHHEAPEHACCSVTNPRGGARDHSYDPRQPNVPIPRKVIKGGSHLCAPNYCRRYRPGRAHGSGRRHLDLAPRPPLHRPTQARELRRSPAVLAAIDALREHPNPDDAFAFGSTDCTA